MSIAQLAEQVGLSPTPCWKRIQRLEADGVIERRVALVNPEQVGLGLTTFVAIEAGGPFAGLAGAVRRRRGGHAGG